MSTVRDGYNRPDDESAPDLSQAEIDERAGWRPIKTAPKDGTKVLIECQGATVEAVYLSRKEIWVSPDGGCGYDPLLWKPIGEADAQD